METHDGFAGGLTVERSSDRKSPRTETRSRSTSDGHDRRDGSDRHRRRRRHHDTCSSPRSVTVATLTVARRYAARIRARDANTYATRTGPSWRARAKARTFRNVAGGVTGPRLGGVPPPRKIFTQIFELTAKDMTENPVNSVKENR